jgi:nucleotide-binding universal stress UspA family protein
MRYLIGVDGSEGSFEAVRFVNGLFNAAKDDIVLYYRPIEITVKVQTEAISEMHERVREALAETIFADAIKHLPSAAHTSVRKILGKQLPAHGLIVAASEVHADVIVVGARGLGPIRRLLLGSVSGQLVQASALPVLVVRGHHNPVAPLKLLVAYDGAIAARQAELLNQCSWPEGTTGQVMRVVEWMFGGPVPKWLEQQSRSADVQALAEAWAHEHQEKHIAREELAKYCEQLPVAFRGRSPIVVEGYPAEQILDTIETEKPDLVIVGKSAGGAVRRLFVGSTSHAVLNHSICSVMVVPLPETP